MEELDLDRHADGLDAAVVAYPHHAAAPVVAGAARAGRAGRRPVAPTSACATLSTYERWYGAHAAPDLLDDAVYGLPELGYRDAIADAARRRQPRLLPDRRAARPRAARARRACSQDVVIDAKTGVSGAGRAATDETHFVVGRRERRRATRSPATGTRRRSTRSWRRSAPQLGPVTFVPHLVPVDQGELITAYVTTDRARPSRTSCARSTTTPTPTSRSSSWPTVPPGMRDVTATNICRISVHGDRHDGRVVVFAAIDNLWKGTSSQAVQNLNLMFGFPEGEGIVVTAGFFNSRWVPKPEHVTELDGGLPAGFRAAGVAAGLKRDGALDVGLLVSDAAETTSAARFTRSGVVAAPVQLCRERCDLAHLRAVAVNAGNANAATGVPGFESAGATQIAASRLTGIDPAGVAVGSTGVIGVQLPVDRVLTGLEAAREQLRADGDADFSAAIQTTDAFEKRAALSVQLPERRGAAERAVQGGGHDLSRTSRRCCASCRPTRRSIPRRPTCCSA